MNDEAPAIGIDLGTTNSCAAVLKDDKIVLIHGGDGSSTSASFVFFENSGSRQVGNLAKDKAFRNIKNGIFGTKRFIGRTYEEFKKEKCMSMFPYTIENKNNKPQIVVNCGNDTMCFHAEEIGAMILSDLKERSEKVMGKKVTKAVITVPAHFSGTQRQATIDAGRIAGLEVLRIINEPTAAVLAFEILNKYKDKSCNVLVYDFGGGTFDVSIATIHNGTITIKASDGDPYLGGDDLNNNLIEHFIQHFKKEEQIDLKHIPKAYERLRHQAERTKILLSSVCEYTASIDCIDASGLDFECTISRSTFEQMNMALFDKTLECIKSTLKNSCINKDDIDEILLVGGSTRIPYVRDLVRGYFKKEPNASIHPDEAVAIGAARQAAICNAEMHNCDALTAVKLFDVCSLSLGICAKGGLMTVIIPRNSTLPASKTRDYISAVDNQVNFGLEVYEGERPLCADNKLLTKFILDGIRLAPKGQVKIDVTFNIDENGILQATAKEIGAENSSQIVVSIHANNLSENEVQNMIKFAEKFKEDDRKKKEIAVYRNTLEDKLYDINNLLNKISDPTEKSQMMRTYEEVNNWLSSNKTPTLPDIKGKIHDIEKIMNFKKTELAIQNIW